MHVDVSDDARGAAARAAEHLAAAIGRAVAERGRAVIALSGGSSPAKMLGALATLDVPWNAVDILQVDERVAPDGDPARNATLLTRVGLPATLHLMEVTEPNLAMAAERYAEVLADVAGVRPQIDVVHLGLGDDGHTASWPPGDPVIDVVDRDVAAVDEFRGHQRLTLTLPVVNRAREVVWLITGVEKAMALRQLLAGDATIPATHVAVDLTTIYADRAAADLT